jgi:hypothetical protein
LCLAVVPGHAQSNPTVVSNDGNENKQNQDKERRDEVPKRIFGVIPNFMTTNDQPKNRGPLTTKQKYNIAWHQFADPSAHLGNLIQAAISQAANAIPHYGQGWGPFGKRFLAQVGDLSVRDSWRKREINSRVVF